MKFIDILRGRIAQLETERAAAIAEIEAAVATAEAEARSALTETEDAAYKAATAKVADVDRQLAEDRNRLVELEQIAVAQTTNTRRAPIPGMGGRPEELDVTKASLEELRGAAATFVEKSRVFAEDRHRESITHYLEHRDSKVAAEVAIRTLATSTDAYIRAWGKIVANQPIFTADEHAALERAMTAGTGSSGGYAVPTPIDPTMIITGAGVKNSIRNYATVRTLADGLVWKGVTAAQVSASYDSEAAEVSDDAPTLSQPLLTTVMARLFVPYSIEASQDIPGLVGDLSMLFGDAIANLEGGSTGFWAGSGAGQPYGLVTEVAATTTSRVSPTTGGAYAVGDIYLLDNAVPNRHHNGNLTWAAGRKVINLTRAFATANNYHAFLTDLGAGQPSQLLGFPITETSAMTTTITTGNDILLLGDFSQFLIMDKIGLQTEVIPHMFATANNLPSGQRGIFAWLRHGSRCLNVDAFRILRL